MTNSTPIRHILTAAALFIGLSGPAVAKTDYDADSESVFAYTAGATLSIFYHELAHALIHTLDVPIFAKEEDVADSLAAWLTHELWTEEGARQNVEAFATSWLLSAVDAGEDDLDLAGVHALDVQRFFNAVCLFYGADAGSREDFAADMELPAERAEQCPEEAEQSARAWKRTLQPLIEAEVPTDQSKGLVWDGSVTESPYSDLIKQEIADINAFMTLPQAVRVNVANCDEPNAFYDPDTVEITICQEYIDYLRVQAVKHDI